MADFQVPPGSSSIFNGPSGTSYLVPPSGIVNIKAFDSLAAFNAGFYPVVTGMATIVPQVDGGDAGTAQASMYYLGDGGASGSKTSPLFDGGGA